MTDVRYAKDGTRLSPVNGDERLFHPTLESALEFARKNGAADLTNTQALEFARVFPLTDNQGIEFELYREIQDDDDVEDGIDFHFTTVTEEDISGDWRLAEGDSVEEALDGYNVYQVWRNQNFK